MLTVAPRKSLQLAASDNFGGDFFQFSPDGGVGTSITLEHLPPAKQIVASGIWDETSVWQLGIPAISHDNVRFTNGDLAVNLTAVGGGNVFGASYPASFAKPLQIGTLEFAGAGDAVNLAGSSTFEGGVGLKTGTIGGGDSGTINISANAKLWINGDIVQTTKAIAIIDNGGEVIFTPASTGVDGYGGLRSVSYNNTPGGVVLFSTFNTNFSQQLVDIVAGDYLGMVDRNGNPVAVTQAQMAAGVLQVAAGGNIYDFSTPFVGGTSIATSPFTGTAAVLFEPSPPTVAVSIDRSDVNLSANTAMLTFTFSEAPTAFTISGNTNAVGGMLSNLQKGDATHYTATFTAADNTDISNASVSVIGGSWQDSNGNPGAGGSTTFTVDTVTPTVAVSIDRSDLNLSANTAMLTFTFSEAPTAFTISGNTNAVGGMLSNLQKGDATHYTATFTAADNTDISNASVSVIGGSWQERNGNPGAGGSTTFTVDTVADAALQASGANVSGTEGASTGGVKVASFTDADPNAVAGDFTATITWGDSTSSAGTVTANGSGGFDVTGAHSYAEEGSLPISVTISDVGGSTASASATASITDAALQASGANISATEGASTGAVTVATFTDANPNAAAGDFSATITWGDGQQTAGTVVATSGGGFAVNGAHTYADEGSYAISVAIADKGGSMTTAASVATVADAALTATG